jgi:hypothetical protein
MLNMNSLATVPNDSWARRRIKTAAVLAVLLAAGCGGPAGTRSSDGSPSRDSATVGQYVSIVNTNRVKLDETFIELSQACQWSAPGQVANDPTLAICNHGPVTASRQAARLHMALTTAAQEHTPGYIGEPPNQIDSLVTQTRDQAARLRRAGGALGKSPCIAQRIPGCQHKLSTFTSAMTALRNRLGAWGTYL